MAESQQSFSYAAPTARALEAQISSKRYATFLKKAGYKDDFAFQLYLYNARLAKAFLFPLHVVEVVLRNAVDEILCSQYSNQWHLNADFRAILTPESLAALNKASGRASKRGAPAQKDDLVSCLTFDFWSNLFRPEYDRSLWQTNIKSLFPQNPTITRASLQSLAKSINDFRNRIAHHEPIFTLDISLQYRQIVDVVSYRSSTAELWLKSHSTVHKVMRTKPSSGLGGGPSLGSICDANFIVLSAAANLSEIRAISKGPFILCEEAVSGAIIGILGFSEIGKFMLAHADDTSLMDLNEYCLGDVCTYFGSSEAYVTLDDVQGTISLTEAFRRDVRYVLVTSVAGIPKGIITKAHRKY